MFDTIVNKGGKEHVPYVKTVNIGRAPTDESVKLLSEMELAAQERLMGLVNVQNNDFNFTAHLFNSPLSFDKKVNVRYELNGKEFKFIVDVPNMRYNEDGMIDLHNDITAKIAKNLSEIITIDIIRNNYEVFAGKA